MNERHKYKPLMYIKVLPFSVKPHVLEILSARHSACILCLLHMWHSIAFNDLFIVITKYFVIIVSLLSKRNQEFLLKTQF